MHPWYRLFYAVALAFAVIRSLKHCREIPLWCATLCACFLGAVFGVSPFAVLSIAILRVCAAVEAFIRVTVHPVRLPGVHLLWSCWLLAAGATLGVRMFFPGAVDPLILRRYLSIWDGLWLLFGLLFVGMCSHSSNRAWRHAVLVLGLVWVEVAGALLKLAGISDAQWWMADGVLYFTGAILLLAWAVIVPRRPLTVHSYPAFGFGTLAAYRAAFFLGLSLG
jgi:hypothetical protein